DEVVPEYDVPGVPSRRPAITSREKELARQIVESLERDWDPKRYHDDYEEQVRALIRAKAKGRTIEAPDTEEPAKVLDLMEALRTSLESGARRQPRSAPKKSKRAGTRKKAAPRRSTA